MGGAALPVFIQENIFEKFFARTTGSEKRK
jgi:hypothetical protein